MVTLRSNDSLVIRNVEAIQTGNLQTLRLLLDENDFLSTARIEDDKRKGESRTILHVATDWPGHFPNGPAVVALLIAAGADVNASFVGQHSETPLHWAASANDVEVLDVLLDAGANIEATGAVVGGGSALDDAVAFGQWHATRRLVQRGARTRLWHAAALGLMSQVEDYFKDDSRRPTPADVTESFWQACHGGQAQVAEFLLDRGVEINWIGYEEQTPLDIAQNSGAGDDMVKWLQERGARSASDVKLTEQAE